MTAELGERYDVVILGGGMAALSLVRLLQLEAPHVSVLTLDKSTGPSRKVGESTVEIAGHFVHTRLALHQHLGHSQLPKNGIRFWFDSPAKDLTFEQASEDGPASFSWWQTYQLERDTLEQTLLDLNRAGGSPHLLGARVLDAEEGQDGEPHLVRFEHEGQTCEVRARWLVDASGPGSLRGRAVGLLSPEERIPHGSAWGWFEGGRSPEELLGQVNKRRFCFGRRILSTNSYMGAGYWIWMIPLASGLLSVGLVYDKTHVSQRPRNQEEFLAFLREHRMLRDVLADADLVEFGRMDNFAFKPSHYLGPNRTAWIGTAAGFVDPLYSSGLDFIALQCEYLVELLRREQAGEAPDPGRLQAYNDFLEQYFEQTVRFFSGLYRTFVSQELVLPRYRRDVHIYWNLYTWPYFSGQFLDPEFLRGHAALAAQAMERSEYFAKLFGYVYEELERSGRLHRANAGRYTFNQLGYRIVPWIRFERQMGRPVDHARRERLLREIDAVTFLELLDVLFDGDRSPLRGLLYAAVHGETLDRLLELARDRALDADYWEQAFRLISQALRARLEELGAPAPGLELTPESWPKAAARIAEAAGAQAEAAKAALNALPALDDLEDLPPVPAEELQTPIEWGHMEHSPWPVGKMEKRTVYDFLGEAWWNKPMGELPTAAWTAAVEAEAARLEAQAAGQAQGPTGGEVSER